MKLILSILLFISLQSQGQIVRTHPYYRPPVSGCSYLLDQYSGAAAAYSLRKLDCDYAGSAIRVRRSSDNTESDIGFTIGGDLDTASLKTFVGTGGSDNGFVVTWYDQSGNANNATQSTNSRQPLIVANGVIYRQNNLPSIHFNFTTTDKYLEASFTQAQPNSVFVVGKSDGTNNRHFFDGRTTRQLIGFAGGNFVIFSGSVVNHVATASATNFQLMTALFNGASSTIQINNGSTTTGNAGSNSIVNPNIGASDIGQAINGYLSEVIFYNSNKSSSASSIKSNIDFYYSTY